MPPVIEVLCVDDNVFVADALKQKLTVAEGFQWVGHLSTADHLVSHIQLIKPHVVLLDLDMPGADPFNALQEVTVHCPQVAVMILSGHVNSRLIDLAIDAGASGYIPKVGAIDSLLDDIQRVARGEFVFGVGHIDSTFHV